MNENYTAPWVIYLIWFLLGLCAGVGLCAILMVMLR